MNSALPKSHNLFHIRHWLYIKQQGRINKDWKESKRNVDFRLGRIL